MKLLFVGYLHGFGGAEKMLINLANEMAKRNHKVYLISLVANFPKYPIHENVIYQYIPENGKNKFSLIKNRYLKLKEYIQIINPDLIINFWFQSAYFCAIMGNNIAKKTIYSERGDPFDKEYNGLLGIVRKFSFRRIGGFVFQSQGAMKCFNEKVQNRSCIIHNPVFVDFRHSYIYKSREKRIVSIGRLHPQKNHKLLIEAFASLPSDKDEYILEIYGEGELKDELQKTINRLNLNHRIFLRGTFKDIHQKIVNASLFVLSSDYEGLPNALLEAMALGLPCISTDCNPGGAREIIKNNVNGIIVPKQNRYELSNAINLLLNDKNLAEKFSVEARNSVESYSPTKIYDEWEAFFGDLK